MEHLEEHKNWMNEHNIFMKYIGAKVTVLRDQYAEVEVVTDERHRNINGTVHGGVLLTLADIAAGAASKSRGNASATLEGKMNFIRPAKVGTKIKAIADVQHCGRKTGVYECKLYDSDNKLLAIALYTMFLLDKKLN